MRDRADEESSFYFHEPTLPSEHIVHLRFKVSLKHIKGVWRRFTIDEGATFEDLHGAIQDAFEWFDCHLWNFTTTARSREVIAEAHGGGVMGAFGMEVGPPASDVPLVEFFGGSRKRCLYTYDFGDEWVHEVSLEGRVDAPEDGRVRALLGGAMAAPPEDCGGPPGYERFAEFARTGRDPWGEPADDLREWLGGWHPDVFDLEDAMDAFDGPPPVEPIAGDDSGVMELIEDGARARGLGDGYLELARSIWNDFYRANGGPGRRRAGTHAACVDYVASNVGFDTTPLTQREVARIYGVSVPSVSNNYRDYGDPEDFRERRYDDDLFEGGLMGALMSSPLMGFGSDGFVASMSSPLPGARWTLRLELEPGPPVYVCEDAERELFRAPADLSRAPTGQSLFSEVVLACIQSVTPSGYPEVFTITHPIFDACAPFIEVMGAEVRFEHAPIQVDRPAWFDAAAARELLDAMSALAARSERADAQLLGLVDDGEVASHVSIHTRSDRPSTPLIEHGLRGGARATLLIGSLPGVDDWLGTSSGATPLVGPSQLLVEVEMRVEAPTRREFELYLLTLRALARLQELDERTSRGQPFTGSHLTSPPLVCHAERAGVTLYVTGPL